MFWKNLARWALARAGEKSTWVGVGTVVAALGAPGIAPVISIGGAILGSALAAATTTPAAPAEASVVG